MSQEVTRQCVIEGIHIYAPEWAMPAVRMTIPGNLLWLLGSIVIRQALGKSGAKWDAWLQAGVFGAALVLYSLMMPWSLIAKLVVFGVEGFR